MKVVLAERLPAQRRRAGLSQVEVAKIVRSSQPRVAKMEAADKTVSIDLLVRALLKTGVSVQEIRRSLEKIAAPKAKERMRLALEAGELALRLYLATQPLGTSLEEGRRRLQRAAHAGRRPSRSNDGP